jgi:hypothetical protein
MEKRVVLLDWVKELSLKQQSVLLSSLRGPDNFHYPEIKKVTKWIRATLQTNADPQKEYMQQEKLPSPKELEKEIEFCTVHYATHLLQALEILGYNHPEKAVSVLAEGYYTHFISEIFHLNPETREQLNKRLEDRVS